MAKSKKDMKKEVRESLLSRLKKKTGDSRFESIDKELKSKKTPCDEMAEKLEGSPIKEVRVASDSKKGLKKGMDIAQEILEKRKMSAKDGGYKSGNVSTADIEKIEKEEAKNLKRMREEKERMKRTGESAGELNFKKKFEDGGTSSSSDSGSGKSDSKGKDDDDKKSAAKKGLAAFGKNLMDSAPKYSFKPADVRPGKFAAEDGGFKEAYKKRRKK